MARGWARAAVATCAVRRQGGRGWGHEGGWGLGAREGGGVGVRVAVLGVPLWCGAQS